MQTVPIKPIKRLGTKGVNDLGRKGHLQLKKTDYEQATIDEHGYL